MSDEVDNKTNHLNLTIITKNIDRENLSFSKCFWNGYIISINPLVFSRDLFNKLKKELEKKGFTLEKYVTLPK